MSLHNAPNDPLTINLPKQARALLAILPPESAYSTQISLASSPKTLLSTLSQLLAVPSLTVPISDFFRPLLVDLCARWLNDQEDLEDRFAALCMLIENHEELFPSVLFDFYFHVINCRIEFCLHSCVGRASRKAR